MSKVTDEKLIELYNRLDETGKAKMRETIPDVPFPKDWRDLITVELCLEHNGTNAEKFMASLKGLDPDEAAFKQLKEAHKAILGNDKPLDIHDTNQYISWPYFKKNVGSGLSFDVYDYDGSVTGVGARLGFADDEKTAFLGKHYEKLHQQFITNKIQS